MLHTWHQDTRHCRVWADKWFSSEWESSSRGTLLWLEVLSPSNMKIYSRTVYKTHKELYTDNPQPCSSPTWCSVSIVQQRTDLVLEDVGQDEDAEEQNKEKKKVSLNHLVELTTDVSQFPPTVQKWSQNISDTNAAICSQSLRNLEVPPTHGVER